MHKHRTYMFKKKEGGVTYLVIGGVVDELNDGFVMAAHLAPHLHLHFQHGQLVVESEE